MLRKLTFTGIVSAAVLGWAAPALAHVTVAPETAPKGATDVQLTFRVPSEEDSATTKVQIALPTEPPLVGVLAQPVPGWTAKVTTHHLSTPIQTDDGPVSDIVTNVTWTADNAAAGIQPDNYQGFDLLAGALPDQGTDVVFKAVQTYANGDVVNWVDPVTAGGPEAEHPTPILKLTAGEPSGSGGETSTTVAAGGSAASTSSSVKDDADTAKTIGIIAIIFSVLALIGVGIGFAMRRRPAS
jgi:uncharacterized protein YcnI